MTYLVMAGNENAPGTLADDALSARLQWLRQRREALQEKLAQKNNELKNICVEEAEITGVLPPEIPLEPGESPPTFHRKTGTTFIYPQNVNKPKTTDVVSYCSYKILMQHNSTLVNILMQLLFVHLGGIGIGVGKAGTTWNCGNCIGHCQ